MLYKYRAKKLSGEEVIATRESADRFTLARIIREEGLVLISAEAAGEPRDNKITGFLNRVSLKQKIFFASNLSAMIKAGLSLSRALGIVSRQSSNKYFKTIVESITGRISRGESLSKSLQSFPNVFPPVFVAMVEAGEESGKLPDSLSIVAEQLGKSYELRRKIRGAMIYPAIIIVVIIVIAVLMMIFLVPTLSTTFKELNVELPLSTRIVIGISDFVTYNYLTFGFGLIAVVAGAVVAARSTKGQRGLDYLFLHLPVIKNLVKQANSAITMRTMSSLVSSGVSMVEALRITERVLQNSYYKEVLVAATDEIQRGMSLSAILKREEKIYPILVGEMAEVGEETGNLSDMLLRAAQFYEDEVDQATKNLSTIIEPLLMVIIGLAVAFFAISMIGPLYSLSNVI